MLVVPKAQQDPQYLQYSKSYSNCIPIIPGKTLVMEQAQTQVCTNAVSLTGECAGF